jgi:hypothetical protein
VALASTLVDGETRPTLFSVDLTTGAAATIGTIGSGRRAVRSIALPPQAGGRAVVALNTGDELLTFDSDVPGQILGRQVVTGLTAGETLVAIDFRPATEQLYGLGSAGRLYTIVPATGVATLVGGPVALSGEAVGLDFDPVRDQIRVTTDTGENVRLDPATGAVVSTDTALAFGAGDVNVGRTPQVFASAYTNNGAAAPELFDLDFARDALLLQSPQYAGRLITVGSLVVDASGVGGLDIMRRRRSNLGLAALNTAGGTRTGFYVIDLGTGAARLVGEIAGGSLLIRDVAVVGG